MDAITFGVRRLAAAFAAEAKPQNENGAPPPENNLMHTRKNATSTRILSVALSAVYVAWTAQAAAGYAFNQIVPDGASP